MKLLYVCTGNTCRSPMAEALTLKWIAERELSEGTIEASSAGIAAWEGAPLSSHASAVLAENGIDFSHEARKLTEGDVASANLILTMTENHKREILLQYPEARQKTYTLKEYVKFLVQQEAQEEKKLETAREAKESVDGLDIEDPIGSDLEQYRKTRDELQTLIAYLLKHLVTS